jgi:hypothetical protein
MAALGLLLSKRCSILITSKQPNGLQPIPSDRNVAAFTSRAFHSIRRQRSAFIDRAAMQRQIVSSTCSLKVPNSISAAIGVSIRPGNSSLQPAFRHMQNASPPVCFRRKRAVGWKRESDIDLVEGSEGALKKIARGARRGSRRRGKVGHFEAMPNNKQLQAATNQTRLHAIQDQASVRSTRHAPTKIPHVQELLDQIKQAGTENAFEEAAILRRQRPWLD